MTTNILKPGGEYARRIALEPFDDGARSLVYLVSAGDRMRVIGNMLENADG